MLQIGVWLGYGLEQFLAGFSNGQPLEYYKLCLFDSACGAVLTLGMRSSAFNSSRNRC